MGFKAQKVKEEIILWIKDWFEKNGPSSPAVIGISGGKDSTIVAALCVAALGKERVFGLILPNGAYRDIEIANAVIKHLGIKSALLDIKPSYDALLNGLGKSVEISHQTRINLAPRLRMSALYAAAQSLAGRVANTSNLSEAYVGYSTRYGDGAGDFSPLLTLTMTEAVAIGHALGLPAEFVDKVPEDGLSGRTDEENLGFTYAMLDNYIRTGICPDAAIKAKIDTLHKINRFKQLPMPRFEYKP